MPNKNVIKLFNEHKIRVKWDGFIWTKRKHYFDGSINPQFFENRKF